MKPIIFIVIKLLLIITITLLVDKHAIWSVQNILELGKTDRPDPSGCGQYTRFPAGCGPAGRTPPDAVSTPGSPPVADRRPDPSVFDNLVST